MKKTLKSAGVLDVLENGNIYIETGASDNLITRLGSSDSGTFKPYKERIKDVTVLYPYVFHKDYIPSNYKSGEDFIGAMDSQVDSNAYIQNYVRVGAEALATYLRGYDLIDDDTWALSITGDRVITEHWFNFFVTEARCKGAWNMFNIDMDVEPDMLSVSPQTPEQEKKDLEELMTTLQRPDRVYQTSEVPFTDEDLRNLDGFLQVDDKVLSNIKMGSMVILLGDYVDSGAPLNEAYRKLTAMGFKVLCAVGIAKKFF